MIKEGENVIPFPSWINQSQFLEILKDSVPNFCKIYSFNVKPALGPGENFASVILRVSIEVELTDKSTESFSYMMKVPHESENMQAMLEVGNFFVVENEAYLNILPKFEALYKSKGIDISFGPKAYKFTEGKTLEPKLMNTVLMYDLGQDGYRNVKRQEGLDFEQTKFVLRKLAQYNAAGAQYFRVHGPYTNQIMQGMFGSEPEKAIAIFKEIMEPLQRLFLANLKNYKNGDKYHSKLVKAFAKMMTVLPKLAKYDPSEFNVLIHGDCWINNLLFKFKPNGEVDDMRFVDFQLPRYGHPAADLLNFLITSVHIDHKLKHFDYFIYYYHSQLIEHLRILNFEGTLPTLRDFHIKLLKYNIWAIESAFMALPIILLDPMESATSDNILSNTAEGDQLKGIMYSNERFKFQIEQILPWLDNRGLLDV